MWQLHVVFRFNLVIGEQIMNQTEDIKELVAALAKAQNAIQPAKFNKKSHLTRYADFLSVMEACRQPLCENGLSVMQFCETMNDKLYLVTMLAHISGQWIKSYYPIMGKNLDLPQALGSAVTYAKRYSLSAMIGVVADDDHDDDAETAMGRGKQKEEEPSKPKKKISLEEVSILKSLDAKFTEEVRVKVHAWLKKIGFSRVEDVLEDSFTKVYAAFEGAVKSIEQVKIS